MQIFLLIPLAYLYGSIPFSVIIPRFFGIHIMESGSKNPGFTNVLRVGGFKMGLVCLILDMSKGFLPTLAVSKMGLLLFGSSFSAQCLIGFVAVLGHCYSPFLKMKGGKGVAAAGGFIFALNYMIAIVLLLILIISIWITRYMSVGSMIAATMFPVIVHLVYGNIAYSAVPSLYSMFIVFKHRTNIIRLIQGTENRFTFKKNKSRSTEIKNEQSHE